MEISRRKFFFFGLAAGVGLFLPDRKIELNWNKTRVDFISETDIIKMELDRIYPKVAKLFETDDFFYATIKNKSKLNYRG